mgnify:CR=1 FL=1
MTDGILKPLIIEPGFNKNNTVYSSRAQWIDGDKVRFRSGYPEKIGGWHRIQTTSTVSARVRAIHTWADLRGQKFIALGHHKGLSLYRSGTDYINITPTDFVSGNISNGTLFGYGAGPYGGNYATTSDIGWNETPTSVSGGLEAELTTWSLDNFGEDLFCTPKGGKIYRWRRSEINERASAVSGAPTKNNFTLIAEPTPYLVTYGTCVLGGAFDPLLIRWPDLDDFTKWTPSITVTAGDYRIQGGSKIIGAVKTKRETLVFTDDVVYSQTLEGGDNIFNFERLGDNCGLLSQNAAIDVNAVVYWMGTGSFYRYGGAVEPFRTPIDEAIFDRTKDTSLNYSQKEKIYSGINPRFNEVWWVYPSKFSDENDRYIIYNYQDDLWVDGTINRTTWIGGDIFEQPIATDEDGFMYYHESEPKNADSLVMRSWIKTGIFDIEDKLFFIDKYIPDININEKMNMTVIGKKYPNAPTITKGPFMITNDTQKINLRLRARQLQLMYESSVLNGDFEFGLQRINIQPDGER